MINKILNALKITHNRPFPPPHHNTYAKFHDDIDTLSIDEHFAIEGISDKLSASRIAQGIREYARRRNKKMYVRIIGSFENGLESYTVYAKRLV